ncbi:protein serine/threonine kinase, putative, partial [Entamoeba invadens IP1]
YNTTLIMQGNSMINATQIITFYGNSSVFLNDNCTLKTHDSIYMNGNSSLEMNGTALLETQNVLYVTDNSTLLMDQYSKIVIGGFVKIYNAFEYQRPTDIRKYYKGGLKVYQGAFLISSNVTVIKGNLYISGISDHKEDIPKIEVDNFGCENGSIFFGKDSLIITHENVNLSLCILDVSFRTIRDIPLFITRNFVFRIITITTTYDFDLIYTDNVYSGRINGASKLLLNGKLTRMGSSEKIFCHLNKVDLSTKRWSYTEPYCPLGNDVDWYITPLYNVTSLLIENTTKSDTMVLKRHQKQTELYSDESATIFDTQISFYKTNNFVVGILANKVTEISTFNLSKNVLFISETNLYHEGITFRAALNKNYTLTRIINPICEYPLIYNKTNHSCYTSVECSDTNCKYCPSDTRSCVQCHSSYSLESGKCVNITNCLYTKANRCLFCSKGYHLQTNGTCSLINNCAIIEFDGKCQLCNYNKQLININGDCIEKDANILNSSEHTIVSCNKGFYINSMTCKNCTDTYSNSLWCENGRTTKCQSTSEMTPNGKCDIKICDNKNESNVRCSVDIPDCLYTTNNKCIECKQNYYIYNNTCQLLNDSHCMLSNTFGCTSCEDNFYLTDTQSCERCDDNCLTCISNSRKCLSCANDYFLANYKCETNDNLKLKCDSFSKDGGCVICKRGYYRVGLDCYDCDVKCETCNNNITCLSCNSTNYRTKSGKCLPQSSIVGCDNVTSDGCLKCSEHYFQINGNECDKCDKNCKACSSQTTCVTCSSDMVLSSYGECLNISSISKCLEITNSQCTKCKFWNSPNIEGKYCETKVVWWVILISVLVIIVFLVFIFIVIVLIIRRILAHLHQKEVEKTTTIFAMKLSNVKFILLRGGISVQSKEIDFNSDIEEMPVNEETKQTFCVGNSSKNVVKIQFTISSKIDKLIIRFDPEIVCTCHITDTIQIVSKNIKNGKECYNSITIIGVTKQSTRLDYDELNEEKKLGEGSFGVVFKGTFRGNTVAIKKMKNSNDDKDKSNEFEKEVNMLDKFRNEYIVHFYGAVFIPSHICMVSEFAEYGSLQDLIKHKKSDDIDMKLRVKMLLDAARGILYLHENGILHRDIKPDNILVFSIELNDGVDAKLTDFGSARNVNLLITNMTFTKGIGTPKYMAPEILNKQHYKKPADVFSFAITMYECFGWTDAYPKQSFTYAWDIVDFVVNGKRLPQPKNIDNNIYKIINEAWDDDVNKRSQIKNIIISLENLNI